MNRSRLLLDFLVFLALLSLTACSRDPLARRDQYMKSAEIYASKGEHQKALLEIKNALRIDAKFAPAYYLLAKEYVATDRYRDAFRALNSCVNFQPDHRDARLWLGSIFLDLHRPKDALSQAQAVLSKNGTDTEALLLAAAAYWASGDMQLSENVLNDLLKYDTKNVRARILLASLRMVEKDLAGAEALFKEVADIGGRTFEAILPLARFYQMQGKPELTEALYLDALRQNPNSLDALAALARTYMDEKKMKEAEELIQRIKQLPNASVDVRSALGDYYLLNGDLEQARQEFESLRAASPGENHFAKKLALIYLQLNKLSDAERVLEPVRKADPTDIHVRLYRAMLRLAQDNPNEATTELQAILKLEPGFAPAHFLLARAALAQGNIYQAKSSLGDALKHEPGMMIARLMLARLQLQTGSPQEARKEIEKILRRNPNSLTPYLMHASTLVAGREYEQAEKELKAILKSLPSEATQQVAATYAALGNLSRARGDLDTERTMFQKAMQADATFSVLVDEVAETYVRQGQPKKAIEFLQLKVKEQPKNPSVLAAFGRVLLIEKNYGEAEKALKQALALDPNHAAAEVLLAQVYLAQGRQGDAERSVKSLVAKYPKANEAHFYAGSYYLEAHRNEDAIREFELCYKQDPGDFRTLNNLAWLYSETGKGNMDIALRYAQEAREKEPTAPDVADTLAWVLIKKGTYGQAISLLQECVSKDGQNPVFLFHLGMAYVGKGDREQAKAYLGRALQTGVNFPGRDQAEREMASLR